TRLTTLHFAPTPSSRENLLNEGVPGERVFVTGNTVIDALHLAQKKVTAQPPEIPGLPATVLTSWKNAPVVLITGHRRENFGGGFESICRAIAASAKKFPDAHFV